MPSLDQEIMEFAEKADYIGPFCALTELRALLEGVPTSSQVRETSLYHYLLGVHDARCFWDRTGRNDL